MMGLAARIPRRKRTQYLWPNASTRDWTLLSVYWSDCKRNILKSRLACSCVSRSVCSGLRRNSSRERLPCKTNGVLIKDDIKAATTMSELGSSPGSICSSSCPRPMSRARKRSARRRLWITHNTSGVRIPASLKYHHSEDWLDFTESGAGLSYQYRGEWEAVISTDNDVVADAPPKRIDAFVRGPCNERLSTSRV